MDTIVWIKIGYEWAQPMHTQTPTYMSREACTCKTANRFKYINANIQSPTLEHIFSFLLSHTHTHIHALNYHVS